MVRYIFGFDQAQTWYDNSDNDLSLQQEQAIEQREEDLNEAIEEEFHECEFALTLDNLRAAFPTATRRDLDSVVNSILERCFEQRKERVHAN